MLGWTDFAANLKTHANKANHQPRRYSVFFLSKTNDDSEYNPTRAEHGKRTATSRECTRWTWEQQRLEYKPTR